MSARAVAAACTVILLAGACSKPQPPGADKRSLLLMESIVEAGAPEPVDRAFVLRHLAQGDNQERAFAAWAVGELGWQDQSGELARMAREESDIYVRLNATNALGKFDDEPTRLALIELLGDPDEQVQNAALSAISISGRSDELEAIGALVREGSDAIRPVALETLVRSGSSAAVPFLVEATNDTAKDVRSVAAFGLGKIGDAAAVPRLRIMLERDRAWDVRANAAQALGMIGDPSARSALELSLQDPNGQVRASAERALEKLGS